MHDQLVGIDLLTVEFREQMLQPCVVGGPTVDRPCKLRGYGFGVRACPAMRVIVTRRMVRRSFRQAHQKFGGGVKLPNSRSISPANAIVVRSFR
jgi:hypothetical protein